MSTTTATRALARATTGDALLVARRRAAQDKGLLIGSAVLLLASLILTSAVPRLLERTADRAVQESILAAGDDADLLARAMPDPYGEGPRDPVTLSYESAGWLRYQFGDVTHPPVVTISSAYTVMRTPEGAFAADLVHVATPGADTEPVRWVVGTAPADLPDQPDEAEDPSGAEAANPLTVQVGLSTAAAAALGITLADGPMTMRRDEPGGYDHVVVTGLYEPVDPTSPIWEDHPGLLGALTSAPGAPVEMRVSAYVPFAAVPDMVGVVGERAVRSSARAAVRTDGMTVSDAHALVTDVMRTSATTGRLQTGLPGVVEAFDAGMAAARALVSLVLAGVATTAALCLVLTASLLTERRRTYFAAERARGASIASVAFRALVESVPVVLLAAVLATGAVLLWLPDQRGSALLTVAVALVAAGAPAVLAARTAAQAANGRRVPADRRDRAAQQARRGARRLVVEGVVVTLAVAALIAVTGRGVVPLESGEIDPLLAAAPVLLASAAALVVVRVSPAVVRAAARWAGRSRGLAAPLAVARAHGATSAVVPLLTVTVAVALVILSGTVVQTVRTGQQLAADELVGAPVRIDGAIAAAGGAELLDRLRGAPGVTTVATGSQVGKRAFGERTGLKATLVVVDAAELDAVRRAQGLPEVAGLAELAEPGPAGTVPALVGGDLLAKAGTEGTEQVMTALNATIRLDVRGATDLTADAGAPPLDTRAAVRFGRPDDGIVVVDRQVLADVTAQEASVDRVWLAGPGAVAAVAAEKIAPPATSGLVVTTRDGWYQAWSQSTLPSALTATFLAATGLLAALAVLALVLVVVATARERGRTLSALRTLGLDGRTARWATLGELAPLVLGGLLGGCVIGLGLPALIGGSLGLRRLTGEPRGTTIDVTWWPIGVAVAALLVALVVAVAVERAVRRRDRLGEVLRVGER
ncbi:hypothetical protein J1G42_15700 [Cellulomonas sp. zg-ZUI222]|uniref:FtsX-like permease family protein n=1 Tax=Cellulomonas wangleii TaxID=2816956 RepID=UPI001A945650|nr:FtsX-like permease family protein [Cellulomonas wangleii]MBO0922265.1 hypothetical protein [Cellulomonas wangleii]